MLDHFPLREGVFGCNRGTSQGPAAPSVKMSGWQWPQREFDQAAARLRTSAAAEPKCRRIRNQIEE